MWIYKSNGIAISNENEIWWLYKIGGHHYITKNVPDDKVLIMINKFGLDTYDLERHICLNKKIIFVHLFKRFI